jgi:hypothetical protein
MTFVHGIEATLEFDGVTLTGYVESNTHNLRVELAEIRPIGESDVLRVAGLRDSTFVSDGAWDATMFAALFNKYKAKEAGDLEFSPDGGTTTFTTSMLIEQLGQRAAGNDAGRFNISLSGTGECELS